MIQILIFLPNLHEIIVEIMNKNSVGDAIIPKVVDVDWKLEIAASGVNGGELQYVVVIKTDAGDVNFTCGPQQLQHLVYKLKDLIRHCEKIKSDLR